MRTHLLCALALGAATLPAAAIAQDSGDISVRSSVGPYCTSLPVSGSTLQVGQLARPDGFVVDEFEGFVGLFVPTYWCNAPSRVTLSGTPLLNQDVPTTSDEAFTTRVDYIAGWQWGSLSSTNGSNLPAKVDDIPTANSGQLIISATSPFTENNRRPLAGQYVGSITLTVVTQ